MLKCNDLICQHINTSQARPSQALGKPGENLARLTEVEISISLTESPSAPGPLVWFSSNLWSRLRSEGNIFTESKPNFLGIGVSLETVNYLAVRVIILFCSISTVKNSFFSSNKVLQRNVKSFTGTTQIFYLINKCTSTLCGATPVFLPQISRED